MFPFKPKHLWGATLLTGIILIIVYRDLVTKSMSDYLDWQKDHEISGAFGFFGLVFAFQILTLPHTYLNVGCAAIFVSIFGMMGGVALCAFLTWMGAALGGMCAFLNGRYVFSSFIESCLVQNSKYLLLSRLIQKDGFGFKISLLLRMSLVMPFSVINYGTALTSLSFQHFALSSVIGCFTDSIFFAILGGSIGAIGNADAGLTSDPTMFAISIVVPTLVLVGVLLVAIKARNEFKTMAAEAPHPVSSGNTANTAPASLELHQSSVL